MINLLVAFVREFKFYNQFLLRSQNNKEVLFISHTYFHFMYSLSPIGYYSYADNTLQTFLLFYITQFILSFSIFYMFHLVLH